MIKIVTDSTCDLPAEVISELGITVVPLYINIGDRGYLDGEEISRAEFYSNLPGYASHPTTGTPGPDRFRKAYRDLIKSGASTVLSIHISEKLSATVNVARSVVNEFSDGQVIIRDSDQLSYGTGFQVETAARMAAEGKNIEEILAALSGMAARTLVAASLDTLEFLRRSGRMNRFMKGLGSFLQLKPILTMEHGQPGSLKVRTSSKARQRLQQLLSGYLPIERFVLLHTHSPEEAEQLHEQLGQLLPPDLVVSSVDITPVLGVHLGPKAVGFAVLRSKTE